MQVPNSKDTTSWRYVNDEVPNQDGDYITVIAYKDNIIVEIAPWREGEYQGSQKMAVYFNQVKVICWMPIPPIDTSKIEVYIAPITD